ncbi:MAG: hypothetical protein G01um10148_524 [Parcubacteria group bacterium Gr01-1014_8]|nr:MAG: hypothetical protein G01um10148_524 [Parcubacteria group bacterium Gr01-1014_8]
MGKYVLALLVLIGAIVAAVWWSGIFAVDMDPSIATDYRNATYEIDLQPIKLENGRAESFVVSDSDAKAITQYFGNDAMGDLNGDGLADVAFLLTQQSGGSGTFYYVAAAQKAGNGYRGMNAVLLGDRIAPQSTEIHNMQIIVNYAERRGDEPMTAQPSIGVSKYFRINNGRLTEEGI